MQDRKNDNLDVSINMLYSTFSASKPDLIDGCPCCTDPKEICVLLETDLKQLNADNLGNYSASLFLTMGDEDDFRYFLPRIFEIASTDKNWWPSPEVLIPKLKLSGWENWSAGDKLAVRSFLRAWLNSLIIKEPPNSEEIDAIICGLATVGEDLPAYLKLVGDNLQLVDELCTRNRDRESGKIKLSNNFWKDCSFSTEPYLHFLEQNCSS